MRPTALALLVLLGLVSGGCLGDLGGGSDAAETGEVAGTQTGSTATTTTAPPPATTRPERPDESAADFLVRVNEALVDSKPARAWTSLHPAHQLAVPQSRFVRCYVRTSDEIPSSAVSVEALSSRSGITASTGIEDTTGTRVRIRYSGPFGLGAEEQDFVAVVVDGEWRWLLPGYVYRDFQRGGCPSF